MKKFLSGEMKVLVATSVAARGLDFKNIEVICYDVAVNREDHLHRIGRCGRSGNLGQAYCLMSKKEKVPWTLSYIKTPVIKYSNPVVQNELPQRKREVKS
jgi:ATP-dependent RNA helicase RhlE